MVPPPDAWSGQGYRNPAGTQPLGCLGSLTQQCVVAKEGGPGECELSLSPNQGRKHKPALLIFSYEKNLSPGKPLSRGSGGLSCWPQDTAQSIEHSRKEETKKQAELQANPIPPQGATHCPPSPSRWTPLPRTLPSAQGRGTGTCLQGGSLEEARPPVTEQAQRPELIPSPHRSHWKHQGQEAGVGVMGTGPLLSQRKPRRPTAWTQSRPSPEHHPPPVKPGKHSWPFHLLQKRGGLAASFFRHSASQQASTVTDGPGITAETSSGFSEVEVTRIWEDTRAGGSGWAGGGSGVREAGTWAHHTGLPSQPQGAEATDCPHGNTRRPKAQASRAPEGLIKPSWQEASLWARSWSQVQWSPSRPCRLDTPRSTCPSPLPTARLPPSPGPTALSVRSSGAKRGHIGKWAPQGEGAALGEGRERGGPWRQDPSPLQGALGFQHLGAPLDPQRRDTKAKRGLGSGDWRERGWAEGGNPGVLSRSGSGGPKKQAGRGEGPLKAREDPEAASSAWPNRGPPVPAGGSSRARVPPPPTPPPAEGAPHPGPSAPRAPVALAGRAEGKSRRARGARGGKR